MLFERLLALMRFLRYFIGFVLRISPTELCRTHLTPAQPKVRVQPPALNQRRSMSRCQAKPEQR